MEEAIAYAEQKTMMMTQGTRFTSQDLFRELTIKGRDKRSRASILHYLEGKKLIKKASWMMERRASGSRGYTTIWEVT